ncbi:MAG: Rrf2 family transcriptional regulator [Acidobacteriota bacterium]|nr:Rrf2 family transcriptional regulator [Acidobacteriota bacterium]
MLFSKAGEYGLQVVLHLAAGQHDGFVTVRELADRCDIPFHFLSKICGRLAQAGILHSSKGPAGGVCLARPATGITLLEVVQAIDGLDGFDRCVLGLEPCDDGLPCPMHDHWHRLKEGVLEMLSGRNLGELADDLLSGNTTLNKEKTPAG